MEFNDLGDAKEKERVEKIWKENLKISDRLAECYYDSVLSEYGKRPQLSSKEDLGFNSFADGIRAGLDVVIPLLDKDKRKEVEDRISSMIDKRTKISKENDKIVKVNCSFCGKEIECPENMLNVEKHGCYDCFKKIRENEIIINNPEKVHFDIPTEDLKEDVPEMLAESCTNNVFPEIWKEYKEEAKEMSRKELAMKMFKLGAGIMADNMVNFEEEKAKDDN